MQGRKLIFNQSILLLDYRSRSIAFIDSILFYALLQLICGYVETNDDIGNEIDRNPNLHFKDKGYFISHTIIIDMV